MKLIDKNALVSEIEKRRDDYIDSLMTAQVYTLCDILDFINALEVKEVNLEKEIDRELKTRWMGEYLNTEKFYESVKHFFELGLQAQKGA